MTKWIGEEDEGGHNIPCKWMIALTVVVSVSPNHLTFVCTFNNFYLDRVGKRKAEPSRSRRE